MIEPSDDGPDFFISYTSADVKWAEWLAWGLEEAKFSTVIQAWDFRPGSNFVVEMDKAASTAKQTLIVLTPNFVKSRFTKPEWAAAFVKDPTGEQRTLVPVLVSPTETGGLLDQIVHINLVGLSPEDALAALIRGIAPGRGKPATAPAFPGGSGTPRVAAQSLDWRPATSELLAKPRADSLPHSWPRSGPATLEVSLVPVEPQSLRVAQLEELTQTMVTAGRAGSLFSLAGGLDSGHTAELAYVQDDRQRFADEVGLLVTRGGQRTGWITLPHDGMGSVVDPQRLPVRLSELIGTLASLDVPVAERYGFTATIRPVMMLTVGDEAVIGNRNKASLGRVREDAFPLAMSDTVLGSAIAGGADEIAKELTARILAAVR